MTRSEPILQQTGAARSFEGQQLRFRHASATLQCEMDFSVYLPPAAQNGPVPAIYWLSGLTCTDENFVQKAGAQQFAAAHGVALVVPDTSPRGDQVPDDPDGAWDFGKGAGFYVDATQAPWSQHYRMYSYITGELVSLVESQLPVTAAKSIMGHSMGGHGAMVIALREPAAWMSVSAFAPICAPSECAWGRKALGQYLGDDPDLWKTYDTCALVTRATRHIPLLVEQGSQDSFLAEQLQPERLQQVCTAHGYPLTYRLREGYDHSYFFIASFIREHIAYHAGHLQGAIPQP